MERRKFLQSSGALGIGITCLGGTLAFLESCAAANLVSSTETGNTLMFSAIELVESKHVLTKSKRYGKPIYVTTLEDGSLSAVLTLCTHKGCEAHPEGEKLVCPCHGSEFSNTGEVLEPPATRPLQKFTARIEGDYVIIDL